MPEAPAGQLEPKEAMRADCSCCSALCCVAPSFRASAEFVADKAAGVPALISCANGPAASTIACAPRATAAAPPSTALALASM